MPLSAYAPISFISGSIMILAASAATAEFALPPELPLGRRGLPEERRQTELAPGLTHTRIVRGAADTGEGFVLETAPLRDRSAAEKIVMDLAETGLVARLDRASENSDRGTPIYLVRADYPTRAAAEAEKEAFEAIAGGAAVRALSDTGEPDVDGPWIVNVLTVDLAAYEGRVDAKLAGGIVAGGANVLEIAEETEGVDAAVNASFFVFRDDWGSTTGRPAGLFVTTGELAAEAIAGRPALAIGRDSIKVLPMVNTTVTLTIDGKTIAADGINRKPGRVVNCGNPGDVQGEASAHDFFCDDPDETIVFNSFFGATSDTGDGIELVVEDGIITDIRNKRGGPIPSQGFTLQAMGADAQRLSELATIGAETSWRYQITSNGETVDPKGWAYMVNGGPLLLRDGQIPPIAQRGVEGWSETFGAEDRLGFYYGWVLRRHPRTAAGVSADGKTLFLVTVDGRQPGVSVGATITEMGEVMQALGAEDAINLDGGGSTTLAIAGEIANSSSDPEPRTVADAILIVRD